MYVAEKERTEPKEPTIEELLSGIHQTYGFLEDCLIELKAARNVPKYLDSADASGERTRDYLSGKMREAMDRVLRMERKYPGSRKVAYYARNIEDVCLKIRPYLILH